MSARNLQEGKKRISYFTLLFVLAFGWIFIKLFTLQVVQGDKLEEKMLGQTIGTVVHYSPRGSILDRNGEKLAVSIMTKTLCVNPLGMDDDPATWQRGKVPQRDPRVLAAQLLSPLVGTSQEKLLEIFRQKAHFSYIKRAMEPNEYAKIKEVIDQNKLAGFYFEEESKRYYTKNKMAAQVLGFVGDADNGMAGIELSMDPAIQGVANPAVQYLMDSHGRAIGETGADDIKPLTIGAVYLTIDAKMQHILEKSLDEAMLKTHAKSACVILMDPHTGEILGMASRPTFDPNEYWKFSQNDFKNRAVGIIYEPGSVFKPIVGVMGLTEKVITPDTPFNDLGSVQVADRTIQNWDGSGMGMITFTDIIKFSVNTGMVDLGMKLGAKRMTDYAKLFGFGRATGIELPGEEEGIVKNPEEMYEPDVATMAIGQTVAVTPLQMLTAICAIANGGELLKPYIVKKVIAGDGSVVQEGHKEVVRRVITPEVAAVMSSMMEKVISDGGGKTAKITGYKVAGKTGTAEKLADTGGYAAGEYIASFVGFVPSDAPQYAMLIMLDTPQGAFYGSQVSAPVFKDTLEQILVAQGVQPSSSVGLPSMETLEKKVGTTTGAKPLPQLSQQPNGQVVLPDLAGLNMRQVAEVLQGGNLVLLPYGSGLANRQRPPAGTNLGTGATVEVWFQ